jgi:hypothetical protein
MLGLPLEIFCDLLVWISASLGDAVIQERLMEYQALRLVCRDWKAAVEGEKRLWTSCSIRYDLGGFSDILMSSAEDQAKAEIDALEHYYVHAADLPLEFEVTIHSYDEGQHGDLKPLTDFVVSWGQRWRTLTLNADEFDTMEITRWIPDLLDCACSSMNITRRSPFANVEHITLWSDSLVEAEPTMGSYLLPLPHLFAGLKSLDIHLPCLFQSHDFPTQLGLPALESLKLEIQLYDDLQHLSLSDILANAANLKYLEFSNSRLGNSLSPTTHMSLQVLIIDGLMSDLRELGTLSLPSLTVLMVQALCPSTGPEQSPETIEELLTTSIVWMAERSQCQLEVLRLSCTAFGDNNSAKLQALFKNLHLFAILKDKVLPDGDITREFQIVRYDRQNMRLDPTVCERVLEDLNRYIDAREHESTMEKEINISETAQDGEVGRICGGRMFMNVGVAARRERDTKAILDVGQARVETLVEIGSSRCENNSVLLARLICLRAIPFLRVASVL